MLDIFGDGSYGAGLEAKVPWPGFIERRQYLLAYSLRLLRQVVNGGFIGWGAQLDQIEAGRPKLGLGDSNAQFRILSRRARRRQPYLACTIDKLESKLDEADDGRREAESRDRVYGRAR